MTMMTKSESLYAYFKEKYGVPKTEVFNKVRTINQSMQIVIPCFVKKTENHEWRMHVETREDNKEAFIVGQLWKNEHSSWSRFFEIVDYRPSSLEDYSHFIFRTVDHEISFDEKSVKELKTFLEILEVFLKML